MQPKLENPKSLSRRDVIKLSGGASLIALVASLFTGKPELARAAAPDIGHGDTETDKRERQRAMKELLVSKEAEDTYAYIQNLTRILTHYQLRYFGKDGWNDDRGFFTACFTNPQDNLLESAVRGNFLTNKMVDWFKDWANWVKSWQESKGKSEQERTVAQTIDTSFLENRGRLTPVNMLRMLNFWLKSQVASAPPDVLLSSAEVDPLDLVLKNQAINPNGENNFDTFWQGLNMQHWTAQNRDGQLIDIKLYRQNRDGELPRLKPGDIILTPGTSPEFQQLRVVVAEKNTKDEAGYDKHWYLLCETQQGMSTDLHDYNVQEGASSINANGVLRTILVDDFELGQLLFGDSKTRGAAFVFHTDNKLVELRKHSKPGAPQAE